MKNRQRNTYKIFIFTLLLSVLFLVTSCDIDKPYDWTILVYMAADNSLSNNALSDINEIESANFSEKKIKIILLADLLNLPNEDTVKEDNYIYDIHHDNDTSKVTSPIIKYDGEIDSGNYNTLSDFANWAYKKYPAIHKALFIWSHGNGWYGYHDKFCVDHSSGNFFNIPRGDLKKAINQINFPINILGLDACNMQTVEVISEVYQNVGYITGSEYEVQADGFPYNDILTHWNEYSLNKNIAKMIAGDFFDSYMVGGSQNYHGDILHISVSSLDANRFSQLIKDMKDFLATDLTAIKSEIKTARDGCSNYLDMDYNSQIDIKQFFSKLKSVLQNENKSTDKIDAILDDIDKSFVYSNYYLFQEDMGYASVWFPQEFSTYKNMIEDYKKLSFDSIGWDKIIEVYFSD